MASFIVIFLIVKAVLSRSSKPSKRPEVSREQRREFSRNPYGPILEKECRDWILSNFGSVDPTAFTVSASSKYKLIQQRLDMTDEEYRQYRMDIESDWFKEWQALGRAEELLDHIYLNA